MKKLFFITLIVTLSATTLFAQQQKPKTKTEKKADKVKIQYTCPMDTDVLSNKPGKCPKCGMTLVKKEAKAPAKSKDALNHMH